MLRDNKLLELRPVLDSVIAQALPDEQFGNQTLRPILKLQHDLLVALFQAYLQEKAIKFTALSAFQQRVTIENAVKKDLPLRHTLVGCIIGLFTGEEYTYYLTHRLSLQKRLTALLIGRLSDTLITPQT
jgi:hypothetical protein